MVESIKQTYNNFEQDVFDSLQLAYKITANSLYGQIGARTSSIYLKEIAACTTATGREMIMLAKKFVEEKRLQVKRMIKSKNFTEIERQGAYEMLKDAKSQ